MTLVGIQCQIKSNAWLFLAISGTNLSRIAQQVPGSYRMIVILNWIEIFIKNQQFLCGCKGRVGLGLIKDESTQIVL